MKAWFKVTKAQLRKGLYHCGERYTWETSYHESHTYAFVQPNKRVVCDFCNLEIETGSLYSIGVRETDPDGGYQGDWVDKVHLKCAGCNSLEEVTLRNPTKYPGFSTLSKEDKIKYLKLAKVEEISEDMLADVLSLTGMTCVVMGEFPEERTELRKKIECKGGVCIEKPNKSTTITHVVLGESGKTDYGQPTGKRSKKYKEVMARKPKPIVVDYEFITNAMASSKNIFEKEEEAKEEVKKSSNEEESKETAKTISKEKPKVSSKKIIEEPEEEEDEEEEEESEEEELDSDTENKKPSNVAKKTSEKTSIDVSKLSELKRKRLQSLAKKHGIKANIKSEEIIHALSQLTIE